MEILVNFYLQAIGQELRLACAPARRSMQWIMILWFAPTARRLDAEVCPGVHHVVALVGAGLGLPAHGLMAEAQCMHDADNHIGVPADSMLGDAKISS